MSDQKKSPKERFFEFVPGFFSWLVLTSPIWLGILAPTAVAFFLIFLSIYWVYLAFINSVGAMVGYRRYKRETNTDWFTECEKLDFAKLPEKETLPENLNEVKHLILIPTVSESLTVLDATFRSLAEQNYALKDNIFIVVSCEERGASIVSASIETIKSRYPQLKNILFYVHPAGIPGELVGGGAPNRTWGATHAVEDLQKRGLNLKNFIFTTFDADTNLHKEFIGRLTYSYLTCHKRFNHFYSTAVFLFNNNFWDVHTLMRIEAASVTMGALSSWTVSRGTIETFSCYSVALDTLIAANYWDVKLIDDTVFYWRAFFARNGDFKPRIFYVPNSSDAVQGENFIKSHISLYKQLLRWGWGSVTTPIALSGILGNKNIPISTKILWYYAKAERHLIFRTIVFLITFGFAILTLVNESVRQTTIAYRVPSIISMILTVGLIFILPPIFLKNKLMKPMPAHWPLWRRIVSQIEGPLVIINLLTFSFIPYLEAETKLMLGRGGQKLYYTPKYRHEKD